MVAKKIDLTLPFSPFAGFCIFWRDIELKA